MRAWLGMIKDILLSYFTICPFTRVGFGLLFLVLPKINLFKVQNNEAPQSCCISIGVPPILWRGIVLPTSVLGIARNIQDDDLLITRLCFLFL